MLKKSIIILLISIISSLTFSLIYCLDVFKVEKIDINNISFYDGNDLFFYMNSADKKGKFGVINGAIVLKDRKSNYFNNNLFLIDKENNAYVLHTINVTRNDVAEQLKLNVGIYYDKIGIASYFINKKIPHGTYNIGVLIRTKDSKIHKYISEFQMVI